MPVHAMTIHTKMENTGNPQKGMRDSGKFGTLDMSSVGQHLLYVVNNADGLE